MLYSPDRNYIFVAVPKTGTTAIQNRLRQIDDRLVLNRLPDIDGKLVKVGNHATVAEMRAILGPRADGLTFVAFLRDPREVLRSKYHFYREGRASRMAARDVATNLRGSTSRGRMLGRLMRVAFARLVPLSLWARAYPFKSSAHFIEAPPGAIAVQRLGAFERLEADFRAIFSDFGYDPTDLTLQIINGTAYAPDPAEDALMDRIARKRLPRDIAQYETLQEHNAERPDDA